MPFLVALRRIEIIARIREIGAGILAVAVEERS